MYVLYVHSRIRYNIFDEIFYMHIIIFIYNMAISIAIPITDFQTTVYVHHIQDVTQ